MSVYEDDQRLVAQCLSGDEDAWTRLVEVYGPYLHGIISRGLGAGRSTVAQEVEQVFSDLFYEIYRDDYRVLRSYSGRSRLSTWLYVVARRRCSAYLSAARRSGVGSEGIEAVPWTGEGPVERAKTAELVTAVRSAMADLPERDKVVLEAYHFKGLKYRQIAAELGVSEENAGMIILRAREKLKKALNKNRDSLL